MKISITGAPGSRHFRIAEMLSSRLGLDLIAARNFTDMPDIDVTLKNEVLHKEDYVIDALSGRTIAGEDAVHIFLDRELTEEKVYFNNMYLQKKEEIKLVSNLYNAKLYNIYINRTGVSDEDVLELIINCLTSGKGGYFLPAYLCLPADIPDGPYKKGLLRLGAEFSVNKFYNTYILLGDYQQALIYNSENKLLKVNDMQINKIPDAHIGDLSKFKWWFSALGVDVELLVTNAMLTKYCYALEIKDIEDTYVKFAMNGNPHKHLKELGYFEH